MAPHPGPPAGTLVQARDQRWRVASSTSYDHCAVVALEGAGPDNTGSAQSLVVVAPFDRVVPVVESTKKAVREAMIHAGLLN